MRRREFITLLGGAAALVSPLAARAQQPVIGFLNAGSSGAYAEFVRAFHVGLGEAGFVEGRNVTVEYRWAEGQYDRLPGFAAELVRAKASVIASAPNPATFAAKGATSTIPIVFMSGPDPVRAGLVPSLSRPGGNVTGITSITSEIAPKRLELMRELVPGSGTFAFLTNFSNERAKPDVADMQAAADKLGQKLVAAGPTNIAEIEAAFERFANSGIGAVIVSADPFFNSVRPQLAAIAARHTMPAMFAERAYVRDGGLLSYGASLADAYRQVGVYTGRVLKGEKPADLPVQRPVKFELVVNLKTAKAQKLTVPESFLLRADEVIE
jgi:putative ABC transport system substrate-binding protein